MPFLLLSGAILSEVIGTVALRESDGFTRLWPSVIVVIGYGLSFWLLALVLRDVSLGFTYAVWAGAGTALIALIGVIHFGEELGLVGVLGIALIIAGVVLLNVAGAH